MLIKKPADILPSEITPPELYRQRRRFLKLSALAATGVVLQGLLPQASAQQKNKLPKTVSSPFSTDEELTPYEDVTGYNNFYEFGTDKKDPALYAPKHLKTRPWSVVVEGNCEKPGTYDIEHFLDDYTLEERIYRLRCVEAWSMVIPWVGVPLADILKTFQPLANAKYVEFTTLYDPEQMRGQNRAVIDWPYIEGLRIDEAMNPLTILAVGLYGEVLPNQNGAPLRLVVPWKYGFKSIKSIVKIRFTEEQPVNTWQVQAPSEYGFFANVDPAVDHPRWSQARERRIGDLFKSDTLPFNGYAEQVAHLYTGMDPKKLF